MPSITEYYDLRADRFSESFRRSGWYSAESQYRRFWALTRPLNPDPALILDVGCGDGEMYKFLGTYFPDWRYVGLDISPNMIRIARTSHPSGLFIEESLENHMGDYDYVIAAGTLNHNQNDQIQYLEQHLTKMYQLAEVAVSISLLSDRCAIEDRHNAFYYYPIHELTEVAVKLTPFFELNGSYATNDICLTLFKR